MPTVLQINIGTRKSTGTIAESINRCAAKNGWDIYFAYGRSVGPSESKLIHISGNCSIGIPSFRQGRPVVSFGHAKTDKEN